MAFFKSPLPWLDKAEAMRQTVELIIQSTALVGGFVGYVDFAEGEAYWLPPQGGRRLWELREERLPSDLFAAPGGSVADAVLHLIEHGKAVTPGSFVFCLSDFSDPPPWTFGSRRSSAASTSCPSSSRIRRGSRASRTWRIVLPMRDEIGPDDRRAGDAAGGCRTPGR